MAIREPTVATLVLPVERARIEAAGHGVFTTMHVDSLDEAVVAVRRGGANAFVLSVHRCDEPELPRLARFVREFPHVSAVALVSRADGNAPHRLLGLGASGVRAVVDVSGPRGWEQLRMLMREPNSPAAAAILGALDSDLAGAPPDCRLFFELMIRGAPHLGTVGRLARALHTVSSSLMSRFYRAELPSPKTYLAHARLLHAAWLFAHGAYSVADVANRLEYSSPQSFGRHLRSLLGLTPGEFRVRLPFPTALERFRTAFVTPYRARLLTFHPLGTLPGDHGRSAA
jgi:AraC-like DNA-binding protein